MKGERLEGEEIHQLCVDKNKTKEESLLVHPRSPEVGKLRNRLNDTVEDDDEGEERRVEDGGGHGVG